MESVLSGSKPLPGSSPGFGFFWAAGLVSESCRQLWLSESLCRLLSFCLRGFLTFIAYSGKEGPGQLQGIPDIILSCLPSCLKSFPVGQNVSVLEENITQ